MKLGWIISWSACIDRLVLAESRGCKTYAFCGAKVPKRQRDVGIEMSEDALPVNLHTVLGKRVALGALACNVFLVSDAIQRNVFSALNSCSAHDG
jgi:hypothetical protein